MSDSNSSQACKGLSWVYDAWGDLLNQNNTSGTCLTFSATAPTNNNQLGSPYTYDAAGNTTYDGTHHYYYDAENRLIQVDGTNGTCSTATVCYGYDAQNRRAVKTLPSGAWTVYIHDLNNNTVAQAYSGGWGPGYIYLNGQLTALYGGASTTYFIHRDPLGSTRLGTGMSTTSYATTPESLDYDPYGQLNSTDAGLVPHEYTGLLYDSLTNSDHADFREYTLREPLVNS